jgi:hypothetical protein
MRGMWKANEAAPIPQAGYLSERHGELGLAIVINFLSRLNSLGGVRLSCQMSG